MSDIPELDRLLKDADGERRYREAEQSVKRDHAMLKACMAWSWLCWVAIGISVIWSAAFEWVLPLAACVGVLAFAAGTITTIAWAANGNEIWDTGLEAWRRCPGRKR